MSAKKVFALTNAYTQDNGLSQGICTAASLAWAKACLLKGGGVKSFSEIGIKQLALEAQMAVIRKLDGSPAEQTEKFGLAIVVSPAVASIDDVISEVKNNAPHIAIFWNSFHTMGYRYAHNDKEFFDMNVGLFHAKTSAEIKIKMEEIFRINAYGRILGLRIVRLN